MVPRPDPRQLDLFAEQVVPAFRTEPTLDTSPVRVGFIPMDEMLIEAGLGSRYSLMTGYALQDTSVPYLPRSIAFPVTLKRDRDGTPHLFVASPVYADLPYVRRVEEATGLKAISHPSASGAFWHHAVDLAADAGWERLAESLEFTTLECVDQAVGLHVIDGELSAANARLLMGRLGVQEPGDRSAAALARIDVNFGSFELDTTAWTAIHAVEDGWIKPGRVGKGRTVYATLTKKALDHVASRRAQAA
ncbi:hypothetical protein BHAOGJBA_2829 [Methylobacterium hispanicum]|uniref:Uncharacterized protein n=1 Tax=Methylobacterium hispanicum TaxID=270350 RepID=A0AAV4ZLY1_9HYPH|nr:hypothetical protein [Methylobacterium hispanicum]GJD89303.1 hypothetical protein BHAOGJBA_2829 [Methylobacterium hispanicum]